jgi:hypothetical protein
LHRLFAVVGLTHNGIDVQLGAGYGFAAGDRVIVMASIGIDVPKS